MKELTLEQIRKEIDQVDVEIRDLFIRRMELAEQVAKVKAETRDSIFKPERENIIITNRSKGMDEHLVMEYKALIRRMMEISRKYQYGITLKLRDCFPFQFVTDEPAVQKLAMLREELYICDFCSRDSVQTVTDYEELAQLLESGRIDAGAGVIDRIGHGVSDSLNTLLLQYGYYINLCRVADLPDGKRKVALFTKELVVRPEHNRLKLVFVAANRSGALGSVLSMISDYEVNVTEIHSIPYRNGKDWNYRFFVELNLNLLEESAQALIFQLSQETESMQLLGSYRCEGDFAE